MSTIQAMSLVFSQKRPFDLVELEQLLMSVGWSQRPMRKVRIALDNSLFFEFFEKYEAINFPKYRNIVENKMNQK